MDPVDCADCGEETAEPVYWAGTSARCPACHKDRMTDEPTRLHKAKYHLCCIVWKLALVVPAIHILLHLLGLPHPEVISFIP